jgi:peptide/nickel transport system substrate-binding protein
LALTAVGLAGCSPSATAPATVPAAGAPAAPAATTAPAAAAAATAVPTKAPKYGGVLRSKNRGEMPFMDPHLSSTAYIHFGPAAAYGRLLKYQLVGEPAGTVNVIGDLAESWDQPDPTTYVFKLRKGVKWHNIAPLNGREVVADDVLYSWNRQRDLKVEATYLAKVQKAEAIDKYTLKVTIPAPDADFLADFASPRTKIVAKEAVDVNGDLKDGPVIGFGPWIFDRWDKKSAVVLKRNPDYFLKGLPYADRLEFILINDDAADLGAFRSKDAVNSLIVPDQMTPKEFEDLKKANPGLVETRFKLVGTGNEFVINASRPPFTDIRVREAMSKALNRREIIDTVFYGLGWLSTGLRMPAPDWHLAEDEMKRLYTQDVPRAKQLLAEAGFPNGFEAEVQVWNGAQIHTTHAELLAAQLRQVGITLRLRSIDNVTLADKVYQGDFPLFVGAGITTPPSADGDLFTKWHSKGGRHITQLKDPKLDAMIEQQAAMVRDPDGRKKALQEIQRYIVGTYVSLHPRGTENIAAQWSDVHNWVDSPPTPETDYLSYMWLDR